MKSFLAAASVAVTAALSGAMAQQRALPEAYDFPDSALVIRNVVFAGNELTKDYIIGREMALKPGELLTYEALEYDINRIYSLQLFNKVSIQVLADSGKATLLVEVSERWFFYPYPILGIKDRDWSHIYYGGGIAHTNVGGRNVQVYAQGALGYDPYVSLQYVNPLIDRDKDLYLSAKMYYSLTRNRSLLSLLGGPNFDERTYGGEMGVGKRFSLYSSCAVFGSYAVVNVSDNRAGRTLSPDGTDRFFSAHLSYAYDTRDLREYPRAGMLLKATASKMGIASSVVDYQRYSADVRQYIPLNSEMALAGRIFSSAVQGGRVPNYGHVFFGYSERIRGEFEKILEGENILGATAEIHLPVIAPRYLRIEEIPIEQFREIRYALYWAFFADAGTAWYRTQPLALNRFRSGCGAGLHLLLSYSTVLRLEYAISTASVRKGEVIMDLGAAL